MLLSLQMSLSTRQLLVLPSDTERGSLVGIGLSSSQSHHLSQLFLMLNPCNNLVTILEIMGSLYFVVGSHFVSEISFLCSQFLNCIKKSIPHLL
jgi:hypothetical protein